MGNQRTFASMAWSAKGKVTRREGFECGDPLVAPARADRAALTQLQRLLHGQEREIFSDQAYWKEADRQAFAASGVRYRINRRPNR